MGIIKPFESVKLFIGILHSPEVPFNALQKELTTIFGAIDYCSAPIEFKHTNYYNNEIGNSILKTFVSFKNQISPDTMYRTKINSNQLEEHWLQTGGKRLVNLDPGIINNYNVILLTTKNYSHRIPLQEGIYAEITLIWKKNDFEDLPWTYPDFKTPEYKSILKTIRSKLK